MIKTLSVKATKKSASKRGNGAVKKSARARSPKDEGIFAEAEKAIAKQLKIPLSKLPTVDADTRLEAARQIVIEEFGADEENAVFALPIQLTPDEYKASVGFYFSIMLTFTARKPLNVRAEMKRYIKTLQEIQKKLPKGKRTPSSEVQAALALRNEGYEWPAIYPLVIKRMGLMKEPEKKIAKKTLRRNTTGLEKVRERRAKKNGVNTSQK
jgi:hypothetical protein